jgi:hypothetical protein
MPSWQKIARRIRVPLGFLFAALYVWLAHPTWRSIIAGSSIAVVGLVTRALASGHVRKNEQLATIGPYAYTRNPLYLGSLIIAMGFALASRSWIITAIAAVMLIAGKKNFCGADSRSSKTTVGESRGSFLGSVGQAPKKGRSLRACTGNIASTTPPRGRRS